MIDKVGFNNHSMEDRDFFGKPNDTPMMTGKDQDEISQAFMDLQKITQNKSGKKKQLLIVKRHMLSSDGPSDIQEKGANSKVIKIQEVTGQANTLSGGIFPNIGCNSPSGPMYQKRQSVDVNQPNFKFPNLNESHTSSMVDLSKTNDSFQLNSKSYNLMND